MAVMVNRQICHWLRKSQCSGNAILPRLKDSAFHIYSTMLLGEEERIKGAAVFMYLVQLNKSDEKSSELPSHQHLHVFNGMNLVVLFNQILWLTLSLLWQIVSQHYMTVYIELWGVTTNITLCPHDIQLIHPPTDKQVNTAA